MQEQAFLRERIEQEIARDPRISGKIEIEVRGRHVRLSGVVRTLEERELAAEIAARFGPIELDNDIAIESTKAISDEDVFDQVQKTIARNPDLAHDIGVGRIINGVAYLRGHSESVSEIEEAARIVAGVPGVKDVVSEVIISTPVLITDEDIVSGINQALHAEPSIHEEFIQITAKNGTATLGGSVKTIEQKILAGNIAKRLPGVYSVINNLDISEAPVSLDQAIENEVVKALEMSPINMVDVRVNVLDGVVYLDGKVDTYKQKDLARRITEAIPGVRYVQNDLNIGFHIEPKAG